MDDRRRTMRIQDDSSRPQSLISNPHSPIASPAISVIIPTYRRPRLLERCLQCLCAQTLDPATYEIIVVDNAGCSQTGRLVERVAAKCRDRGPVLRYLREATARGAAAARNRGWRAARSQIIAFTDDDCLPQPRWLAAGRAAFANGKLGAMGRTVVPLPENPTDYERTTAQLAHSHFITANCFYRRDVLENVGGFDERFTVAWCEDSDLFFRVQKAGALAYAPQAVVYHPPRPAAWGDSLGQQRKSMFNALLYKKHPAAYRAAVQPSPPWGYYRAVLGFLGAFLALLTGRKRAARTLLLLWAFITGRFAADRLRHTSRAPGHVAEMLVTSALIPFLSIFWRLRGALKFRVFFL